jgi:hypothetical protein
MGRNKKKYLFVFLTWELMIVIMGIFGKCELCSLCLGVTLTWKL